MEGRESRILSGKGLFVDDLEAPNMAHCLFVGSPYAHARIRKIDLTKARQQPGIVALLTGHDLLSMIEPLPPTADFSGPGRIWRVPQVYPLAVEKVRFQGEPVAAIIAESLRAALDAADAVEVDYEPLPAATDALQALDPGSPRIYDDWEDNVQLRVKFNYGEADRAFAEADRVIKISWSEGRVSAFPLEPRGCLAVFDPLTENLSVWGSFQCPFRSQHAIAHVLRLSQTQVRIIASDIGGAFGNKVNCWKYIVPCLASKMTGRPVKWRESTREFFLTGPHQRDVFWDCEAAVRNDGRVLAVRGRFIQDVGVEISNRDNAGPSINAACSAVPNAYALKGVQLEALGVVTNKSFYGAYRGFGKDKGAKLMERIMDRVARELQLDPAEVRFRNFIQPQQFPYRQVSGFVYDSGDYPALWRDALRTAEMEKWRATQARLRKEGRYVGIGMAFVVEPAGLAALNARYSGLVQARVRMTSEGSFEVFSDRTEIGQGAERTQRIVIAEILGVEPEKVVVRPVTSDLAGMGPVSSRGAVYSVSALAKAARELRALLAKVAAAGFEEDPAHIGMKDGFVFSTRDPRQRMSLRELAERFYFRPGPRGLPTEMQLNHQTVPDITSSWFSPNTAKNPTTTYTTFSSAADIVVVEVDPGTGATQILKYVHAHDAGKVISREIVDGQIHGGILQGIGEALTEELLYAPDGALGTNSYADFIMPTALDAPPEILLRHMETPSPFTELGTKGMGESPIIGSKAALISAIEDALAPWGVEITTAPATRERVRKWIKDKSETRNPKSETNSQQ